MTTFPGSPRLLKGALVAIDPNNPVPSVIVFQYNPETLTRTLTPRTSGGERARSEALRLSDPPEESIRLDVQIDAIDQLEKGAAPAVEMGIYPQLSALELLLYPKSSHVIDNTILLSVGTIEIMPPEAPFTLFIWGKKRILPVRLTDFSITEEDFDPSLNPIRAKVSLGLRVLSYSDLPTDHRGYHLFLAHQTAKEAMARLAISSDLSSVLGQNINLL